MRHTDYLLHPMGQAISNLRALLAAMDPQLHSGIYAFCVVPHDTDITGLAPIAIVREAEGLTLVLPEEQAIRANWPILFQAKWITLMVHSDLQAIGLTAAFSTALGQAGISCNVLAGGFHDHLFVPPESAQQALAILQALQQQSADETDL